MGVLGETGVELTATALVKPARQLGLKLVPAGAGTADAFDAAFETMAHGGAEANPWLARALTDSPARFLQLKMGLTGAGVWILVAHHQCPLAVRGLYGLALVYGAVLVYHLLLYVRWV